MASCLSSSSASPSRCDLMRLSAALYCSAARGGTGRSGAWGETAPADAPVAAPGGVLAADGVPPGGACDEVVLSAFGTAAGLGAAAGFGGALWQAARSASAPAPMSLTNGFDQLFTLLHLAIATGIELRERCEALLHPLIVIPVLGTRCIHLVQLDRLLLEWKRLLFEQHVVLLELVLGEILRPLGAHDILAELPIELGALERRRRRHLGHLIVRRLLISLEGRLHRLALLRERLLEGRHQLDAHERLPRGGRERQRRTRCERLAAVGACGTRGTVGGDDLAQPAIARCAVPGLLGELRELVAGLHGRIQRLREALHECLEHGARALGLSCLAVERRGLHGRLALNLQTLARRGGDALELGRRLRGSIRL